MARLTLLVIVNACLLTGIASAVGLRINLTDSLPPGLYVETDAPIARGTLVETCLPPEAARLGVARGYLLAGGACVDHAPVLKRVAALAGDRIAIGETVRINGSLVPRAPVHAHDGSRRSLTRHPGGAVPPGSVWLLADHVPRSFDSRYIGPVSQSLIRSTVRPLWVL